MSEYVELHCHSNYSFHEGASFLEELVLGAKELGYPALALTNHDNLCGAFEFARHANGKGIQPITGAEVTLTDGSHVTLLAETRQGYSNLCNLMTASRMGMDGDRCDPRLNPGTLGERAEGLILLTGCSKGRVPSLIAEGKLNDAETELRAYIEQFGRDNVFVELQQNLADGDTQRNRHLVQLAQAHDVQVIATNNVHYHIPERHRLQDALVAIRHNKSLDETHRERRPNANFYLRSAKEMSTYFRSLPKAISNTLAVAERCTFNLETNLGYRFPKYENLPPDHTSQSYLEKICNEAAVRKYGSITPQVQARLNEEFRLINMHDLAGFFLIYYEVIQIAREAMIDLGHSEWEIPLEERPPGRGRGSSVAMLVGYLIGLSHIDPLRYDLKLDRFLNEEMGKAPDIDIDFPRDIRDETIKRVHQKYGPDRAVLTGAIATYKMKGCIRDLGKAFGLPSEDVDKLAKRVDTRHAESLESEMAILPDFRDKVDNPVWQMLLELADELRGFPKHLMQHSGGMIISDTPMVDVVPMQPGGMEGRYICQWDRDTVMDAGFVKIDFLALGALSQMQEALELVNERTGKYIDLSPIDFEDKSVYDSIHKADTIGIFQIESAAQMQTVIRLKPKNLQEMAYEVAAVRPGVGHNDGVIQFIERYTKKVKWDYDHPNEAPALERTLGIILFQDQVNELAVSVAGFTYSEADELRRAFSRKNNTSLLETYWEKFRDGAAENGVPEDAAQKVFNKFSGQYMFPESHAYAFGITAYQMSWLKYHHPLEFFVAIFNQQPMGFYNLETLKEDAKHHDIVVLNPDINQGSDKCIIKDGKSFLLGFLNVKGLGAAHAEAIIVARRDGSFHSLGDAMRRTELQREAIENLVTAGAFDSLIADRRSAQWEIGLLYQPIGSQQPLALPVEQDMAQLPLMTDWESILGEYRTMGVHPKGHIMAQLRPHLPNIVLTTKTASELKGGSKVTVAGKVIRRQHPGANAIFVSIEDEFGQISCIVWPKVFKRYRLVIFEEILSLRGTISRRDNTLNLVVEHMEPIPVLASLPSSRNWG
jgi:error-prone DNA polymerase